MRRIVKVATIVQKIVALPGMNLKINWDGLGIITSLACAIHCAILPLLVTSLPLFGINIIHNLFFEWAMIGLAFVVGIYSLIHGYKKHHRSIYPLFLFFAGFLFLVTKQFLHSFELVFLIPAVILIVGAHIMNLQLCKRTRCRSAHHSH